MTESSGATVAKERAKANLAWEITRFEGWADKHREQRTSVTKTRRDVISEVEEEHC